MRFQDFKKILKMRFLITLTNEYSHNLLKFEDTELIRYMQA